MFLLLYDLLFFVFFLLYLPFYLVHIYRRGGITGDYWMRFGFFSAEKKKELRSLRNPVWIHAVSVGETIAAMTYIRAWQARYPEDDVVFSCSTSTAYQTILKKNLPGVHLIYCPFDFGWAIRHVLSLVRPRVLSIFEVEIWPNMILQAARRGVQVCLVNGRMSDRSARGYAKWAWFFRPLFRAFSVLCVQTEEDAERIARVTRTRENIVVCDTMKFDQVPDPRSVDVTGMLDRCFGALPRTVLVAGSTHPGEETLILNAYDVLRKEYPELKLVIVPRHVERTPEVLDLLRQRQMTWQLVKPGQGEVSPEPSDVLIVNTTGELMNYYSAAEIAYVGKSLAGQTGGHNIIEPAIFGKAILYGHHMENFRAVAEIFQSRQAAVEVPSDEAFLPALRDLLANPEKRAALGRAARETVDRYRGAIGRTLDAIAARGK